MRRKIRRMLFSAMLAISMIAAFFVSGDVTVSYAATTHSVSTYNELLSAISHAESGDAIDITADIVVLAELAVDQTLSINGNGHTVSVPVPGLDDSGTLNADASAFRVFNLISGTLTINDMTIKGGAAEGAGSGILVETGAALYLNTVTVSNSGGPDREGGGIMNYGATYLYNCNIIRNGAAYGGGFLNEGFDAKMYIENCSFSENRSLSGSGGGGGGENKSSAYLYINNSTFSNNKSTELGGAINNYYGISYILNSTFTGNVNYYDPVSGGALRIAGEVYLVNNIFAYNYSSEDAGNSYFLNDFDALPTAASYCMFHGSMAAGTGNVQYMGAADGSDNSLFTGGSTTKVLAANGMEMGTATVYQPYLARIAGSVTASVPLQPDRDAALCAGTKTGFANVGGSAVVGYYSPEASAWVVLAGSDAASFEVTSDQNGSPRASTPTKGAVETTIAALYMIKVNASAGGTVNGGTVYGDTYAPGASVTLTAIPADGYKLLRWTDVTDSGTLSNANPYTFTVSRSLTIAPVFEALAAGEYIITYVSNENTGGAVPASGTYTAPATISDNTGNLTKTGYLFIGWNTRANGSGAGYAAGDTYSLGANLTLYAQWERGLTVTFDSQGGSSVPSVTAADGSTVADPGGPTKAGWGFGGWYRESGCANVWNFAADTVTGDVTLYAKWTPIPLVFNGGTLPEGTYHAAYRTSVEALDGSGSSTYELVSGALPAGLELSTDGGITGTPTMPGNNTFTVKATDTINGETATAEFTLKIAPLGTLAAPFAAPASGRIDYGDAVELSVTTPEAAIHYTVNGDTPTVDSTLYTGAITLYADTAIKAVAVKAGWNNSSVSALSYTIKTYTISYDGNGASGGKAPVEPTAYRKGDAAGVRGNPGLLTKTGYTFGGWNTRPDKSGKHYVEGGVLTVREDTVLYAEWHMNSYTVTFKDWNGDALKTQTVTYGSAATAPAESKRAGYTFTGWSTPFSKITGDTKVAAEYKINRYTVTFDTGGGNASASQSVLYSEKAKIPASPEKDGYLFDVWYTDSALTLPYDFNSAVTQDITLYAGWVENSLVLQQTAKALTTKTAFRFASGDTWECVTDNFVILYNGDFDTKLTWTSSDTDIVQIKPSAENTVGVVIRPEDKDANIIITATISKDALSVSKTFLLIVKQKGVSKQETRIPVERAASVRLGEASDFVTLYRTTVDDGATIDFINVLPETVVQMIRQSGQSGHIIVTVGNDETHPADEYAFEIPSESVSMLVESGIGVTLASPAGSITISAKSLEQAGQNGDSLYFRIVPVEKEAKQAAESFLSDATIFSLSDPKTGQVFGVPQIIQTNMESFATTITLPLAGLDEDQLADAAFMETLCVYVEHDDGTAELVYGTLIYADNMPTHIRFDISRFSRFQIVSIKEASAASPWTWIPFYAVGFALLLALFVILAICRKRSAASQPV